MTNIMDSFPKGMTPRKDQEDILRQIEKDYESYDYFMICAPTGSGKSAIAYTLANWQYDTGIVTSTKTLQDQYAKSFPEIPVIKGKNNFKCQYLIDQNRTTNQSRMESFTSNAPIVVTESSDYYVENNLTCNFGPCTKKQGNKDDECEYKKCGCDYYEQRDVGLGSDTCIFNYAFLFIMLNLPIQIEGINRTNMIYDEAHKLEDELLGYTSLNLSKSLIASLELKRSLHCNSITEVMDLMRDVKNAAVEKMAVLLESSQYTEANKFAKQSEKIQEIYNMVVRKPENYVWDTKSFNGKTVGLTLQPVDISHLAGRFLRAEKQFFMSGTLSRNALCDELGLEQASVVGLEVDKFAIPLKNRRVEFANICEMKYGMEAAEYEYALDYLGYLADEHSNERGLILVNKKSVYNDLMEQVKPETKMRLIEGHAYNEDGTNVKDSLDRFKSSDNGILVSASMWEGVDLKDDLARWCVLFKCPYPFMGDKRIKKLMEIKKSWYSAKTVAKILQGLGRCVRSETDYAKIYCVDSKIRQTLERNKRFMPAAYHDILEGE